MWIYTVDGFYSAVQDRENEGIIMARARKIEDLERMILRLNRAGHWPGVTITTTAGTDYAFRVFMPRDSWELYVRLATSAIDYDNFKNAAAPHSDDRHEAYYRVWEIMADWQAGRIRPLPRQRQLWGWRPSFGSRTIAEDEEVSPILATYELVKQGATQDEVSDRLSESYNIEEIEAALAATNDLVLRPYLQHVIEQWGGDPQVLIDEQWPPEHGTYDEFAADLAFDADRERRLFGR